MIVKPGLSDTQLCTHLGLRSLIVEAVSFFAKNYENVNVSDKDTSILQSIKNFGNPCMSALFSSIIDSDKLNIFKFFDYSRLKHAAVGIPEILTVGAITIDGKYTTVHMDDRLKTIWCNITPYIRKRTSESEKIQFSDIDKIHELVVRGALCRSYQESPTWFTSDIAAMIIESYALTIGNILSSAYKLSFQDSNLIVLLFAAYYAQLLHIDGSMSMPELLVKCKKLNQMGIDVNLITYINKFRVDPNQVLSLKEICDIISKHGHVKMAGFNSKILSSLFSKGTVDNQLMLIALEYPPYYVMQLLRLADNYKNYTLSSNPNNKKVAQILAEKLRTESTFIPKL